MKVLEKGMENVHGDGSTKGETPPPPPPPPPFKLHQQLNQAPLSLIF